MFRTMDRRVAWISKQLERLVLNWIWPYIHPHLDPDQMGGRPGCSIEHYIVKMVHFILQSMDGDFDAAVLGVPVDYSKAFNRMKHSDIMCNLIALNVPTCAVKLIKSYLTQRSMCVRYKGEELSWRWTPRGPVNRGPVLPPGEQGRKTMLPSPASSPRAGNHPWPTCQYPRASSHQEC